MENKYYVYRWFDILNNKTIYIGKGCGDRYKRKNHRNKLFQEYIKQHECSSEIIYNNLSEEESYNKEIDTIEYYWGRGECHCNISKGGVAIGAVGENNYSYGKSIRERLGDKYDKWLEDHKKIIGNKNPNYGNRTLSKRYKENPKLAKEKQARIGSQNGKAIPVSLYINDKFEKQFGYLEECAQYLIDKYHWEIKSNSLAIRINIHRKNNTYYKKIFSFK